MEKRRFWKDQTPELQSSKAGEQLRVRLRNTAGLEAFRAKLESTMTSGGYVMRPGASMTKGQVLDVALDIANQSMNPDYLVVHRERFFARINAEINSKIDLLTSVDDPEQRAAMLEMIVTACASVAPVSADAPLRASEPASDREN